MSTHPIKLLSHLFLIIFIHSIMNTITTLAQPDFRSYVCGDTGNYTKNSPYQTNLNTVLSNLHTTNSGFGFFNLSSAQVNDRVNSAALCQGNMEPDLCLSCLNNSIVKLRQLCPNQKQAVGYYGTCLLKYSDNTLLGNNQMEGSGIVVNVNTAQDSDQFVRDLDELMTKLKASAVVGGSLLKFATGSTTGTGFSTIYGLVQCTPDLSEMQCSDCLEDAYNRYVGSGFSGRVGGTVFLPACRYSYDISRFFNGSTLVIPPPPPPPSILQETPPVLAAPPPRVFSGSNSNMTRSVIIIVVTIVTVGLIIIAFFCILIQIRKRKKEKVTQIYVDTENTDIGHIESLKYNFSIVREATNNFSLANKLGQGGFGAVYKGVLDDGRKIAVKRLAINSGQGEIEFKNEVLLLAKLHHRNLVKLLGFSLEGSERLLIYEFLPNASLDRYIFGPAKSILLDWQKRYNVIKGIAKGLLYLHEDSRLRIIHRDMKASNVLLDSDLNPKIADFGIARLFSPDETQGQASRIVGTYGYMAPEYVFHGQFSVKSDVFSFGVLVLEMITGQKNQSFQNGESMEYLIGFAWKSWQNNRATNIIDPVLKARSGSLSDIIRSIHIGLLCVQENVNDRPTMASVVLMLNSHSHSLPVPSVPAFFVNINIHPEVPIYEYTSSSLTLRNHPGKSKQSKYPPSQLSINDVSMSEIVPR